jgi:hypothetical protein
MAYANYIHCMSCGEKALYWESWSYIGCAHCEGDLERAERGVVEAYCPECTAQRNPGPVGEPLEKADGQESTTHQLVTRSMVGRAQVRDVERLSRAWQGDIAIEYGIEDPEEIVIRGRWLRRIRVPRNAWEFVRSEFDHAIDSHARPEQP